MPWPEDNRLPWIQWHGRQVLCRCHHRYLRAMPWERSISLQRLRRCSGPDDFSNTPPYDGHVTRCCVVEWLINHAYVEGDTAAMSVAVLGPVKAAPPEFESGVSLECRPPLVRKDRNQDIRQFVLQESTRGARVRRKGKMISWIR
jgi:hypothetical protein